MDTVNEQTSEQELQKTKRQLEILYEISNAMRTTLALDEILYVILTAVTAHAGLGFNRAMLFLINDAGRELEGVMGIGPGSGEEAHQIWQSLDPSRMTLSDLVAAYRQFRATPPAGLDALVRTIRVPLQEQDGVLALAALEGMPFEILTPEARMRFHDPSLAQLGLDRFVVVPLKARDRVIGVIAADHRFTGKPITKDDVRLLTMCANQAGLAIENSRLYEQTLHAAQTDSLTGLWNHGAFQRLLEDELARAARYHNTLSLALLDLDDFKHFNDSFGHQAGDHLLVQTARLLRDVARTTDHVARYGGEEFAIIFPETDQAQAAEACERMRAGIGQLAPASMPAGVTISIGLAAFAQDAQTKDKLIYAADMALLEAKRAGKNRTCLAKALQPQPSLSPAVSA